MYDGQTENSQIKVKLFLFGDHSSSIEFHKVERS